MTLPLVACSGNKGDKPNPGPGPDVEPKEVKRTELLAAFNEIGAAVTGDTSFAFDEEQDTYVNEGNEHYYATDIYEGSKTDGDTWESALQDFMSEMPSKYTKVLDVREFTWDDGDKGLETAYELGETIYVSVATWEDESTDIYVSYAVMPNEGVTYVEDEIVSPYATKTVVFKHASYTGSLDLAPSQESFVTWFNNGDNVLNNISLVEGTYAQMQTFGGKNDPIDARFLLASGKKDGDITFTFNKQIKEIELVVQPYSKYDDYNGIWRNDLNSTLAINGTTDIVDLSTTITTKETEETTITRTFSSSDNQTTLRLIAETAKRVMLTSMTITYIK